MERTACTFSKDTQYNRISFIVALVVSCSRCSFTAQFESALSMHHQLHHDCEPLEPLDQFPTKLVADKSHTVPMAAAAKDMSFNHNKHTLLPRTSSATRLLGKLRARISRSRHLFSHPEETADQNIHVLPAASECTSKALKSEVMSRCSTAVNDVKDVYSCHLCGFDADRITVLDRHLLNDHKIGLENLLKLVLAKTKDGLSEDIPNPLYGIRQPYYKPPDEIIEEGEFIIETVLPKIKILKHASTNTDLQWISDLRDNCIPDFRDKCIPDFRDNCIPDLKDNCRKISNELDRLIDNPTNEKSDLLNKMQTLNACMCKLVDSSNMMNKVLSKEIEGKHNGRSTYMSCGSPTFELGLGDQESPRDWERAHSENLERNRIKHDKCRSDKTKLTAESYYF